MKYMTHVLQAKYRYFHNVMYDERNELFMRYQTCRHSLERVYLLELVYDNETLQDPDTDIILKTYDNFLFFHTRRYIIYYQDEIMKLWNVSESRKNKIIKVFERDKLIKKRTAYKTILLNLFFCSDICNLIIDFLI